MKRSAPLLCLLLASCGEPSETDAGVAAPDSAAPPFVEPTPPAPPVFGPCPSGWSTVDSTEGFDVCEPPSGAPCPTGTERFVDSPTCVPVGDACPAGEWADAPEGRTAVYVRAGASGGDGTVGAPYGSIQDAISRAPPRSALLLSRGTFEEAIDIFGGLSLIGACATDTVIAPSTGGAAVRAAELNTSLANVTLRPGPGLRGVEVTGDLELRGVVVEGATFDSVFVFDGGALEASSLVVRDARPDPPDLGRGLTVTQGTVNITSAIFERCPGTGLLVGLGGSLNARAVVVRDSGRLLLDGPQIITQEAGATLTLSDSVLEQATGTGIFANEGSLVRVDQVVIRDLAGDPTIESIVGGVYLGSRARLEATRLRVENVHAIGLAFVQESRALVEDTYVNRVMQHPLLDEPFALGVLYSGPDLILRRVAIRDIDRMGVHVERGSVLLEDVSIERVVHLPGVETPPGGVGQVEGSATLRRVRIAECQGVGMLSQNVDLVLEDVWVHDISGLNDGRFGRGLDLTTTDGTLSRVLVERTREIGIHVVWDSSIEATQIRVLETLGRDCQTTTCPDTPGGIGIAAINGAFVARDFEVDGARLCGTMVAVGGGLDLRQGAIRNTTVGACVQVPDYDVARLTNAVLFQDNGTNVDATEHAIPEEGNPLGSFDL